METGAGEESRTLDLNLGKVALYQLSYSRDNESNYNLLLVMQIANDQTKNGGAARSRTGLAGFAIRYITALLPRHFLQLFQ